VSAQVLPEELFGGRGVVPHRAGTL
jgi:hypothetical protein